MSQDRISYDTGTSSQVQSDIDGIVSQLEALIGERDQQVAQAMADFQMDGADEEYRHVESRWSSASNEVKSIISLVREALVSNDQTATSTQSKTRGAISNIG